MKKLLFTICLLLCITCAFGQMTYRMLNLSVDDGTTWISASGSVIVSNNVVVIAQEDDEICVLVFDEATFEEYPENKQFAFDCKIVFADGLQLSGNVIFQYTENMRTVWVAFSAVDVDYYLTYHLMRIDPRKQ